MTKLITKADVRKANDEMLAAMLDNSISLEELNVIGDRFVEIAKLYNSQSK
jgi:hypothetical protein